MGLHSRFWLGAAGFAAVLGAWVVLSSGGFVSPLFLPAPTAVLEALVELFLRRGLLGDVAVSTYRIMVGFLVSVAAAVPIGALIGGFRSIEALLEPVNDFIRYLPVPALVPLAILWLGIGDAQKVFVIFVGTFFQLTLLVAADVRAVPPVYRDLAYTLGASPRTALRTVLFPAALPRIFESCRIALGWAWSYLVVAEVVAANTGIGFAIMQGLRFLRTADVIAAIIVVGLLGLAFDAALKGLRGRLFPWEAT